MTTPSKAEAADQDLLTRETVRLSVVARDRADAIDQAGRVLLEIGAIEQAYVDAMHEREAVMSSYMGEGFALPHGTDESRRHVNRAAVAFLQFSEPVLWEDDEEALAALAVAATSDEHVGILATLARVLVDEDKAERLRTTADVDEVLELLAPTVEEEIG
ncbi:MAG TPA: PTS sugar transporter subunit IIA [Euzebyales bacterium]|nr:PTS sugar transporter subunit IIA [Euzebyales bacterium]